MENVSPSSDFEYADDTHPVALLYPVASHPVPIEHNARTLSRNPNIGQSGKHRHLMSPLSKLLANISDLKRFRPISLGDNKDPHLAPSPVLSTPSVASIIFRSMRIERFSMYSMSSLDFSLGSSS